MCNQSNQQVQCCMPATVQLLVQIYTGYMQRDFVPVEQRGKGKTDANVNAPVQLRNDNPHTEHTENGSEHGTCILQVVSA